MRGSLLVGKIIKRVHQRRFDGNAGPQPSWTLEAIEFTDGSVLRFLVLEHREAFDYGVEAIYPGRGINEP